MTVRGIFDALGNSWRVPELRRRIIFTMGAIAIYRLGSFIPIPGVDFRAFQQLIHQQTEAGGVAGLLNLFTGGAFGRLSIFALGIMPYITTSILMQLLTTVIPAMEKMAKEGEVGRKKINQIIRYATIGICLVQGSAMAMVVKGSGPIIMPGVSPAHFIFLALVTWTVGTMFLMWLGDQMSEQGIGNGVSLLIFASIVERMPMMVRDLVLYVQHGEKNVIVPIVFLALIVVMIGFVVWLQGGHRKIPVQYAQRVVGRRVYGGQSTYLPIKVDHSGVIAIIFAQAVLQFPQMLLEPFKANAFFSAFHRALNPTSVIYNILYFAMIVLFCYFYTAIIFNPNDIAENIKKYGGFIPGVRPGKPTAIFIEYVLVRITLAGALGVGVLAIVPNLMFKDFMGINFLFGGTSILIVVGVALDTMKQIESHLLSRHYEGFMKQGKLKTRAAF